MSIKKLQDLLNPSPRLIPKEKPVNAPVTKQSPQSLQKSLSHNNMNQQVNISGSPRFTELLGGQNIFYTPFSKSNQEVCPSPAITKQPIKDSISLFSTSSKNTAPDTGTHSFNQENANDSQTLNSLVNQLGNQLNTQPKTLQQLLLQNSISSLPSQSIFQSSIASQMPSPFIGISNQSSNLASSGASDLNNILTQSLLGTPIQNPNFINQQPQVTQQTTNLDNMLNNQVAQLLQLENEKKIQALTEMLKVAIQQQQQQQQQLQAQQLQQQIQQQLQVQQLQAQQLQAQQLQAQQLQAQQLQAQQLQAQLFSLNNSSNQQQSLTLENLLIQDQQQKIALSNGLLMNPIKRIVPPVSQVDPRLNVKIDQTRKELLNLDGSKKKDEILEEMSFNQQRQKFATMATQPLSLINLIESQNTNPLTNNLNPQLQSQIQTQIQTQIQSQIQPSNQQPKSSPNLSSLLQQQMENMTLQNNSNNLEHTPSAENTSMNTENENDWTILENNESLANYAIYKNSNKGTGKIGIYTKDERLGKILRYKNKIRKWRTSHPVNRNFRGRSQVAGKKPRIKGKFVTIEEYSAYLQSQKPGNSAHNESSSYITDHSDFSSDFSIKEEAK